MMNAIDPDGLHRLAKEALDSGAAGTIEQAEAMLRSYRLDVAIGDVAAGTECHQAALLTTVALARRVFLGGVFVTGALDVPLLARVAIHVSTLKDAVLSLGGSIRDGRSSSMLVTIGGQAVARERAFHVRTVCAGWRAGIAPVELDLDLGERAAMPLGSMLAAALAVNEAFLFARSETRAAGRRVVGLSLWSPDQIDGWREAGDEPDISFLPTHLWLIGLGHLGQAYLWALGLLPYPDPSALAVVLQDIDTITASTESTSILSDASAVGIKKTRAMAAWAEHRGFTTTIHERLFDDSFRRQQREPPIALCGLDNAIGRRALDRVGFELVVEAGLGRGYRDFRTIRTHTLSASRAASEIWRGDSVGEDLSHRAAYQALLNDGALDRCGVTLLAGKAVGAPFVGATAACLVISEVLRLLHGGPLHAVVDLDLHDVDHRTTVLRAEDSSGLNPGYVRVAH